MKILCIGPQWRGSNAGGLFKALSRRNCIIQIVDEFYFLSLQAKQKKNKIIQKLIRPLQEVEFNNEIKSKIITFKPDVFFVYKGTFVKPETILFAKEKGCKLVLFFPDVSMTNHGNNIPKALVLYDIIFTTKTFGIKDLEQYFGVKNAVFIPHGFDPEIHKKFENIDEYKKLFGCDVSFIGTYSAHKAKLLGALKNGLPEIDLKIWGSQWEGIANLKGSYQGVPVTGDLYALAIQCSKINLGLLSEVVRGASSGDLITSRTFHIPASNGFMLHERNEESVLYFEEGTEAAFFDGEDEMIQKIKYYLQNDDVRNKVTEAGYQKALSTHSLDNRADEILSHLKK